jgi:hypothetical protein
MIPATEGAGEPASRSPSGDVRRRSALANIPEFVRPMAKTGIERFAWERGSLKWTRRSSTRPKISACEHAAAGRQPLARPCCPLEPHLPLHLACEHCYLDAGGAPQVGGAPTGAVWHRGSFRVIDDISAFAPECVTILTGGSALRRDIPKIARRASERGPWSSSAPTA